MVKKICFIIFIVIILISMMSNNCVKAISIDEIFGGGDGFVELGKNSINIGDGDIKDISNLIYQILYSIFMLLAIVIGIVLGIKYITASVEGKAEVKQSLIVYFVAVVILFGAYGIWKTVIEILN